MNSIQSLCTTLLVASIAALPIGILQADPAADAASAIDKAESARQKAASVGGEWRDTNKMIKQARAAAQKGDFTTAQTLANQAYHQGEWGYQQAVREKDADFPSYLQ